MGAQDWQIRVHRVCATLCSCRCHQAVLYVGLPTIRCTPRGRHTPAPPIPVDAFSSLVAGPSYNLTSLCLCCCRGTLQVQWFWDTVKVLTDRQRSNVLAFVTSSCAPPAGGFAHLRGFNGARHTFEIHLVSSQGDGRQVDRERLCCWAQLTVSAWTCWEHSGSVQQHAYTWLDKHYAL